MKQGMTNVDVAALAAELAPLVVGARVDRAYQPGKEVILLRLRRKGTGRVDLLFELGKFLTATRRPPENPDKPSMVAQILRTSLENSRVNAFHQVGFDRIVRMDLERGDGKRSLVFELFGDGNLVLLDAEGTILLPMRAGEFSARRVKKGEPYVLPPGSAHPFALDLAGLRAAAEGGRSKDLVRFLALDLGFGPMWAEELCLRADVEKSTRLTDMDEAQWQAMHGTIQSLGGDISRNDLAPALVYDAGGTATATNESAAGATGATEGPKPIDAVPFVMKRFPPPRFSQQESPSFREALDELFVGTVDADGEGQSVEEDPRQGPFNDAKGKLLRQVHQVETAIAGFRVEEAAARQEAEALYASFGQAQAVLESLNKARQDRSWAQVEETLQAGRVDRNPLALQVPELRPHNGTALLRLASPEGKPLTVEVDLRLSVQENADAHYAVAKRAKARRDGAEVALQDARDKLEALESKGLDAFGTAPARAERVSRHFWFESYRWTVTPNGLLAVGGRSGPQNDAVVKKYLREGDRYVHAEIHGAPSVVVRPAEAVATDISTEDLRAAAHFAVVSSRAWRQAGPATAYWVTPEQVSKTPRSGEYVPKGAWIIHGKRNVETDLPMEWWAGKVRFLPSGVPIPHSEWEAHAQARTFEKLAGGTLPAMRRFTAGCVKFVPGKVDPNDAAQELAARFAVSNEDAMAVLPAGPVEILPEPQHPMRSEATV